MNIQINTVIERYCRFADGNIILVANGKNINQVRCICFDKCTEADRQRCEKYKEQLNEDNH